MISMKCSVADLMSNRAIHTGGVTGVKQGMRLGAAANSGFY